MKSLSSTIKPVSLAALGAVLFGAPMSAQCATLSFLKGSEAVYADIVANAPVPVVVVVTGPNCQACDSVKKLFEGAADKRGKDYRMVVGDHDSWGIPSNLLPFVLTIAKGKGVISRAPNAAPVTEADAEKLLDARTGAD